MRGVLWRAAAWLLAPAETQPELSVVWLPAIDAEGDRVRLTVGRIPTASEAEWAMHPEPRMREAYAIHAVTLARETAECAGYRLGWEANDRGQADA